MTADEQAYEKWIARIEAGITDEDRRAAEAFHERAKAFPNGFDGDLAAAGWPREAIELAARHGVVIDGLWAPPFEELLRLDCEMAECRTRWNRTRDGADAARFHETQTKREAVQARCVQLGMM